MSDLFQWAIIAIIVFGIAYHVWKAGSANPVGTGRLQRDLTAIKGDVAKLKDASKATAKASDLAHLKEDMERTQTERSQAMTDLRSQIGKIGDEVDVLQKECANRLATVEATTTATAKQVDLLYQHIVAKGMG